METENRQRFELGFRGASNDIHNYLIGVGFVRQDGSNGGRIEFYQKDGIKLFLHRGYVIGELCKHEGPALTTQMSLNSRNGNGMDLDKMALEIGEKFDGAVYDVVNKCFLRNWKKSKK